MYFYFENRNAMVQLIADTIAQLDRLSRDLGQTQPPDGAYFQQIPAQVYKRLEYARISLEAAALAYEDYASEWRGNIEARNKATRSTSSGDLSRPSSGEAGGIPPGSGLSS